MKIKQTFYVAALLSGVFGVSSCVGPNQQRADDERIDKLIEQQGRMLDVIVRMITPQASAVKAPVVPVESSGMPSQAVVKPVESEAVVRPAASKMTGRLRSVGSDTMDGLMEHWSPEFHQQFPLVVLHHQGRGSSTAIPALIEQTAEVAPMSRPVTEAERTSFREKFGYEPMLIRVGVDAVAVYVHPDNPLAKQGLTLQQLDGIFSKTRKRGGPEVLTWGDLGLAGTWAKAPVNLYSRNNVSGTYAFFSSTVMMKGGEFRDHCTILSGSEELVKSIANDRYGIGYSGVGYMNRTVASVPLSNEKGGEFYPSEMQHAYSGEYPLSRFLYLAVNKDPKQPLNPVVREFLAYVFSEAGQNVVAKDGFFPVSSKIITEERAKLGM